MKNNECIITIYSDNFNQYWYKENDKWKQITNGVEREVTSEQLISHILPLLLEDYDGKFKIKVNKK